MVPSLEDERRQREANEAVDPEELLREGPPEEEPAEETVLEEGVPTAEVATVVIEEFGVPGAGSAVVVDMNPSRPEEGVDILDIATPAGTVIDATAPKRRRGRRGNGHSRDTRGAKGEAEDEAEGGSAAGAEGVAKAGAERFARRQAEQDLSRRRKLAYMLALEVRRVVEELELRQGLLIDVWSRMRVRQPLLSVLRTRYEQVSPTDLLTLPAACLEHLDQFYRTLDEFRLYLHVTEDMPTALEITYVQFKVALTRLSRPLLWYLDLAHGYEGSAARGHRSGDILEDVLA